MPEIETPATGSEKYNPREPAGVVKAVKLPLENNAAQPTEEVKEAPLS
jgi:hypothetical protein